MEDAHAPAATTTKASTKTVTNEEARVLPASIVVEAAPDGWLRKTLRRILDAATLGNVLALVGVIVAVVSSYLVLRRTPTPALPTPPLTIRQSTPRWSESFSLSVANTASIGGTNRVYEDETLWLQLGGVGGGSHISWIAVDGDREVFTKQEGVGAAWERWAGPPPGPLTIMALATERSVSPQRLASIVRAVDGFGPLPEGVYVELTGRSFEFLEYVSRGPSASASGAAFRTWCADLFERFNEEFGDRWAVSGLSFTVHESN